MINKYPDGTSYVSIVKEGDNSMVTHTCKLNSYEDLWHLNQLVDACNSRGVFPLITIPFLIDAQADKRFNIGESSGLKLVCKFLNSMRASFSVFHPHNAEVVEGLLDSVNIVDNYEFIETVLDRLSSVSNLTLFSSDAGGFKPLMKLCDKIGWRGDTESASKSRKYENGESKLIQSVDKQDFNGKDILIVDDICVYGGTFKGLSKILRERNCGMLYLAVSHITIQNHKGKDDVFKYFDKVFTTNSKFDDYYIEDRKGEALSPPNLEVIRLF